MLAVTEYASGFQWTLGALTALISVASVVFLIAIAVYYYSTDKKEE